jgi:uncharacterized protein YpmB
MKNIIFTIIILAVIASGLYFLSQIGKEEGLEQVEFDRD